MPASQMFVQQLSHLVLVQMSLSNGLSLHQMIAEIVGRYAVAEAA